MLPQIVLQARAQLEPLWLSPAHSPRRCAVRVYPARTHRGLRGAQSSRAFVTGRVAGFIGKRSSYQPDIPGTACRYEGATTSETAKHLRFVTTGPPTPGRGAAPGHACSGAVADAPRSAKLSPHLRDRDPRSMRCNFALPSGSATACDCGTCVPNRKIERCQMSLVQVLEMGMSIISHTHMRSEVTRLMQVLANSRVGAGLGEKKVR